MMIRKRALFKVNLYFILMIFLFACLEDKMICAYGQSASPKTLKDSLLILKTDSRKNLGSYPWEFPHARTLTSLAIAVEQNLFMTLAANIAGGVGFQLQRLGSPDLIDAEVVYANFEANVALLRFKSDMRIRNLRPLKLIENPLIPMDIGDLVDIRNHSEVDIHEVSLRNLTLGATQTGYRTLPYQIYDSATATHVTPGAPIIREGRLAALVVEQKDRKIYALRESIIAKVLREYFSLGRKNSFGDLLIYARSLESPDLRHYLGIRSAETQGIIVTAVSKKSPLSGKIEPLDVITHINGIKLNFYGEYEKPDFGLTPFIELLSTYDTKAPINLEIIRRGKRLEAEAELQASSSTNFSLPFDLGRHEINHVIAGGAIIQEVNEEYFYKFEQNPEKWEESLPVDLAMLLSYDNEPESYPERSYFVLREILPNLYVNGYESYRHIVIKRVNNSLITSFAQLQEAIKTPIDIKNKKFLVLEFNAQVFPFIIAMENLEQANNIVKEKYQIDKNAIFFPELTTDMKK